MTKKYTKTLNSEDYDIKLYLQNPYFLKNKITTFFSPKFYINKTRITKKEKLMYYYLLQNLSHNRLRNAFKDENTKNKFIKNINNKN